MPDNHSAKIKKASNSILQNLLVLSLKYVQTHMRPFYTCLQTFKKVNCIWSYTTLIKNLKKSWDIFCCAVYVEAQFMMTWSTAVFQSHVNWTGDVSLKSVEFGFKQMIKLPLTLNENRVSCRKLNQTVRGIRVNILRSGYLVFLVFLCLLSLISAQLCSLSHGATFVDFVGSFRQQGLLRQNCILNSLE